MPVTIQPTTLKYKDQNGTWHQADCLKGEQGPQGPVGETGATGPVGATGATPAFTIGTVTDVPYGTPSSATITGTAAAPVLNLQLQHGQSGNETIDDTKGNGDTDFVWSASKTYNEVNGLKSALLNDESVIKRCCFDFIEDSTYTGNSNYYRKISVLSTTKVYAFAVTASVTGTYNFATHTATSAGSFVDIIANQYSFVANQEVLFFQYTPSASGAQYLRLSGDIPWTAKVYEIPETASDLIALSGNFNQLNDDYNHYFDRFTKTQPNKQLFNAYNAEIIKGLRAGANNKFTNDLPRNALVLIGEINGVSGQQYTFNCISENAYSYYDIDNINLVASNVYPALGESYTQTGSYNASEKRATLTLNGNTKYLMLSIQLASGTDIDEYDFDPILSVIVVRKGGYDTTYYDYDLLNVNEPDLSASIREKLNQTGDVNAYRQILYRTLYAESNVLTEESVDLGTNWSGTISSGLVHTSGSTDDVGFNIQTETGKDYLISMTLSNTAEKSVYVKLGNSPVVDVYNGSTNIMVGITSDGGTLSIIPDTSWNGTITSLQLRKLDETGDEITFLAKDVDTKVNDPSITGFWNVIIGVDNFKKNENGSRNISIGYSSFANFKSGTRNIGVGTFALSQLVSGERNIAIGADSLWLSTHADDCIAIGKATMEGVGTSVQYDIAIGNRALNKITTGKNNIAIGEQAIGNASTNDASQNVAVGSQAGHYGHYNNTHVGHKAGYYNKGDCNVSLGSEAGSDLYNTGNNNICIGYKAGIKDPTSSSGNIVTINNSIAIGKEVKATKSGQMILGSTEITEVVLCGNKKIVFNQDGTVTWETIS